MRQEKGGVKQGAAIYFDREGMSTHMVSERGAAILKKVGEAVDDYDD